MSQIVGFTKDGCQIIYGCDHALGYFVTKFGKVKDDGDEPVLFDANIYGIGARRVGVHDILEYLRKELVNPQAHATYLRRVGSDLDPLSDRGIGAEPGRRVVAAKMAEDHAPTVEKEKS